MRREPPGQATAREAADLAGGPSERPGAVSGCAYFMLPGGLTGPVGSSGPPDGGLVDPVVPPVRVAWPPADGCWPAAGVPVAVRAAVPT